MIHLFDKNDKFSPHLPKWGELRVFGTREVVCHATLEFGKEVTSVSCCEKCNKTKKIIEVKKLKLSEKERKKRLQYLGAGDDLYL